MRAHVPLHDASRVDAMIVHLARPTGKLLLAGHPGAQPRDLKNRRTYATRGLGPDDSRRFRGENLTREL
jgi:hypothetical protein